MKPQWLLTMLTVLLVVLAANALRAAPPASTDTEPSEPAATSDEQATTPAEEGVDVTSKSHREGLAAAKEHDIACRASDLIGMSVTNKEGKTLGSLDDLVFDPKTGAIRYAALSRGGILGIGKKLVAVPWSAFEFELKERERRAFRPDDQPQAETHRGVISEDHFSLILDMDAETLDAHPGFKDDSWPEVGDESLKKEGKGTGEVSPTVEPLESQNDKPVEQPVTPPQ